MGGMKVSELEFLLICWAIFSVACFSSRLMPVESYQSTSSSHASSSHSASLMKVSELEFLRLLPAFMRDDEAAIALSKAMNRLIGEPSKGRGSAS